MAHTGIFATSDEILLKAGSGVDATGATEGRINSLCLQVESEINATCRFNFSDAYASLNADTKGILSLLESNLVAIYLISFNMDDTSYSSRIVAEDMVNILRDAALRNLNLLKDKKAQEFVKGTV